MRSRRGGRRAAPTGRHGTLLAFAVLLACPGAALAQDAYLYALRGSSGSAAFARTSGIGVAGAFPLADWLSLRVGFDTRAAADDRLGRTCRIPVHDIHCTVEPISSEYRFTAVDVTLIPYFEPVAPVRLSAGAGVLLGVADASSDALSGRMPDIYVTETPHAGLALLASLELRPLSHVPVVLFAEGQARRITLEACRSQGEEHTPFCGSDWWSEVRGGLGIRF